MSMPLYIRKALKLGVVTTGRGKNKKTSWSNKKVFDAIAPDDALDVINGCIRARIPFPEVLLTSARLSPKFTEREAGRMASCGYTAPFYKEEGAWKYGVSGRDDIVTNVATTEIMIHMTHEMPSHLNNLDIRSRYVLPENDPISVLRRYGFNVGLRDPRVNPEDKGRWMVTEASSDEIEKGECSPDHCFSIVGDDLHALAIEARDHFEFEKSYAYVVVKLSDLPHLMKNGIEAKAPDDAVWPEYGSIEHGLSEGESFDDKTLRAATGPRVFGHATPAGARSEAGFVDGLCILRIPVMDGSWEKLLNDTSMNADCIYKVGDISTESLDYSDIRLPGIDNEYEPLTSHLERMERKQSLHEAGGIKPSPMPGR